MKERHPNRVFVLIGLILCLMSLAADARAQHPILNVEFEIIWMEVEDFDANVTLILTDFEGAGIEGWDNIPLAPDLERIWWRETLVNVREEAVGFKFTWDLGVGIDWDPEPAIYGEIDWEEEEMFEWTFATDQ